MAVRLNGFSIIYGSGLTGVVGESGGFFRGTFFLNIRENFTLKCLPDQKAILC